MIKRQYKFLLIGDVFGPPGIEICQQQVPLLKQKHGIDFVIANGENAAKEGRGIDEKSSTALFALGVDFITTGNHVWRCDKFYTQLNNSTKIIRPLNFPHGVPGKGYMIVEKDGLRIGIINAMGRVFFKEHLNCPFREIESLLIFLKSKTDVILVDFHAEATAEKISLAYFLDGKITALWGTHTHVQTADNRILPKGSAYISDLGFCGALHSCIGAEKNTVINHFLSQMPARFKVEDQKPYVFSGAILTVAQNDEGSFVATDFSRVYEVLS